MRLLRFEPYDTNAATFTFPAYDISLSDGRAEARSNFQMTPRGGFDPHGNDDAVHRPFDIIVDFDQIETTAVALQTAKDATKALFGKRGKLYAEPYNVGTEPTWQRTERWIDARCVQTPYERLIENYHYQPMALVFEVERLPWHGLPRPIWQFDEGFDETTLLPTTVVWDGNTEWDGGGFTQDMVLSPQLYQSGLANNRGNFPVTDAVFTVIAGGAAITHLEIEGGGAHLIFKDTIAAGKALVIDCGNLTVENDGVNAYTTAAFELGANHAIDTWCRFAPGETTITITWTGGTEDLLVDQNGGFEAPYASGLANGWTKTGSPTVAEVTSGVAEGSSAQSITNTDEATDSIKNTVAVNAGDVLTYVVKAKRTAGTGDGRVNTVSGGAETVTLTTDNYVEYRRTLVSTVTSEFIELYADDTATTVVYDDAKIIRADYSKFAVSFDDGWA